MTVSNVFQMRFSCHASLDINPEGGTDNSDFPSNSSIAVPAYIPIGV